MPRLVLADDNLTTQRMVELSLETEGYEVIPFTNGKKALEYVLQNEVDVVLANVSLPGLDGYSLCARIADEPDRVDIPVVLVVGALDEAEADKAQKAGSVAVLSKPFSTSGLLDVVTSARKQVDEEPALASNLFEIPVNGSEEEVLFELSLSQACSSTRTLMHEHLKPSVSDLAAMEAARKVDHMAKQFSERLAKQLAQIVPELTDEICSDLT